MDASTIAATKGADVFVFDYPYLDVAHVETLGSGYWGRWQADGTVAVGQTLTPQIGNDGVTSQPGTFTANISLFQLTSYTTARVHYDGQGFSLDYSIDNGTTWTTLPEDGVIVQPPSLDLRVTFPGNIALDSAVLNSLSVYVLNTETMRSQNNLRTLTLTNDPVTANGLVIGSTPVTVDAASTTVLTDPGDPTVPTGPADYSVSAIEMWTTPTTTSVFFNAPAGTIYTNGVVGAPVVGVKQHVVLVLTTPTNTAVSLQASQTVSHLAFYQQPFNANDVLNLYIAQTGGQVLSVNDSSTIGVTESSPATDIYAYSWQIYSINNS